MDGAGPQHAGKTFFRGAFGLNASGHWPEDVCHGGNQRPESTQNGYFHFAPGAVDSHHPVLLDGSDWFCHPLVGRWLAGIEAEAGAIGAAGRQLAPHRGGGAGLQRGSRRGVRRA